MCVLCTSRRARLRQAVVRLLANDTEPEQLHVSAPTPLTADEKRRLLSSLAEQLRDVVEVVPAGQPVTRMRHDATLHAAPGVRVTTGRT
jgi:hypothetical protein